MQRDEVRLTGGRDLRIGVYRPDGRQHVRARVAVGERVPVLDQVSAQEGEPLAGGLLDHVRERMLLGSHLRAGDPVLGGVGGLDVAGPIGGRDLIG